MKIEDIRALPSEELVGEIAKLRNAIFKMQFRGKGEALESPGALKEHRRDIARMLTVVRERETAASRAEAN